MNGFKCTFRDLRHTFATMMIANGCDVRTVASYLGHASVSMTLDIYADVDPDAKRAAVDNLAPHALTLPRRLAVDVSTRLIKLHRRFVQKGYGYAR
ncbi:tyrosine-type recombinase/integrase [Olsenella profusa]|uniref:Site-specific recombinase, phage integrase domain protein n=1 Tax=Olsenella profusa F0195 TaxID=1125712 RepID=U2VB26_9ACTN|nr:tyrosine-type recombinase/integrase [Olsenella profusa]ERL09771.1 site-specific recombinase, phage integrase domain protein [Olsenella profusa F0195]